MMESGGNDVALGGGEFGQARLETPGDKVGRAAQTPMR